MGGFASGRPARSTQKEQRKTKGRERAGNKTDRRTRGPATGGGTGKPRARRGPHGRPEGGLPHTNHGLGNRPWMGSRSPRGARRAFPSGPPPPRPRGRKGDPPRGSLNLRAGTRRSRYPDRAGADTTRATPGRDGTPPDRNDRTTKRSVGAGAAAEARGGRPDTPDGNNGSAPRCGRQKGEPVGKEGRPRDTGRRGARAAARVGGARGTEGHRTRAQRTGPDLEKKEEGGALGSSAPRLPPRAPPRPRAGRRLARLGTAGRTHTHSREPGTRLPARENEASGGGTPPALSVNDPSAGSPTETLLRLLLPLDSQVRPSSQRSTRAVGRPRRGRSEGLTKPSNR